MSKQFTMVRRPVDCTAGPVKRLVKKIKRKLSCKSKKMEAKGVSQAPVSQSSEPISEESSACVFPQEYRGPSLPCPLLPSDSFSNNKAATMPCMSTSSSCSLYTTCASIGQTTPNSPYLRKNTSVLSSDSGVCIESESDSEEYEGEYNDVFTDSEGYYEDTQTLDDDSWWIDGDQISLRRVLLSSFCDETVYSGYWHGNVEVHSRRTSDSELRAGVISDVNMLTSIRHENIQLFLGVCDDLHTDYISIVMDQMKGNTLYNLVHKQNKQFTCQAVNKIASQIAQGIDYLHAKGISHPMLTSKAITLHYRVCISMLSNHGASSGYVESDDLVYLPPETIKTVSTLPVIRSTRRASNSVPLVADPYTMQTPEANIFSYGTLMYELLAMEKPYASTPANTIISQVGDNDRDYPLDSLPRGKYKQLIRKCWRSNVTERPTFKELLRILEHNASPKACGLKSSSHLSLSEPKRLDRVGL